MIVAALPLVVGLIFAQPVGLLWVVAVRHDAFEVIASVTSTTIPVSIAQARTSRAPREYLASFVFWPVRRALHLAVFTHEGRQEQAFPV